MAQSALLKKQRANNNQGLLFVLNETIRRRRIADQMVFLDSFQGSKLLFTLHLPALTPWCIIGRILTAGCYKYDDSN